MIRTLPSEASLTPGELARQTGFPSAKRQHDWALGRAAGKQAVVRLLESEGRVAPPLTAIEIGSARSGAPRVAGELQGPVALSLTHGHGLAGAIALRPGPAGRLPGVDLERVRPRRDTGLRFFLGEDEQARVLAQPRLESEQITPRDRMAILYWSLKEAAFKALQLPRGVGLLDVGVELPEDWEQPTGRAEACYWRAAAERYGALGGGCVDAGWEWLEPDLVVAWVTVSGAPLPEPDWEQEPG